MTSVPLETYAVRWLELNANACCRGGLTQIVVLTYPLVGNYGVPDQTLEDVYGEAGSPLAQPCVPAEVDFSLDLRLTAPPRLRRSPQECRVRQGSRGGVRGN